MGYMCIGKEEIYLLLKNDRAKRSDKFKIDDMLLKIYMWRGYWDQSSAGKADN